MSARDRGGWAGHCSEMRGQEAGRRLQGRNIGAGVRSSGDSGRSPATPHTAPPAEAEGSLASVDMTSESRTREREDNVRRWGIKNEAGERGSRSKIKSISILYVVCKP